MNCSRFRRDLPDWLRGGLSDSHSMEMSAHSIGCRTCAREEALERHLRTSWKSLPEAAKAPDVWPRVATALERAAEPRIIWRPARLAAASVFAAGALLALFLTNNPGTTGGSASLSIPPREEQQVIRMVSELRQLPDLDSERMAMDPPHLRNSAILLGISEGR